MRSLNRKGYIFFINLSDSEIQRACLRFFRPQGLLGNGFICASSDIIFALMDIWFLKAFLQNGGQFQ